MTDELTPATAPEPTDSTAPPPAEDEEAVESGAEDVAGVEAFWKKRVSNKDASHKEAERVLRSQLAEAQKQLSQSATSQASGDSGEQVATARIAELEAQLAAQHIETLKMKYPALAEQVGDDNTIFKATDEATLAKLNASITKDSGPAPVIDHSTPRRSTPTGPKPTEQKTTAELEADLRKFGPEWQEAVRSGI